MKIIVVEDDIIKRSFIESFFKFRKDELYFFQSVRPAISYATKHSTEIHGIILDLGLSSYDHYDKDYSETRGLDLIEELAKKEIYIPILINSSVYVDLEKISRNYHPTILQMESEDYWIGTFLSCIDKK